MQILDYNFVVLATSTNTLSVGEWNYIEIKFVIGNSGSFEVRVNGSSEGWIPQTVGDIQNGATTTVNNICFCTYYDISASLDYCIDDLYVCNSSGATNNDFLGDVKVETLYPNANGNYSQWTGSDADQVDNYSLVNETVYTSDSAPYVTAETANTIDTYQFSNLSTITNVKGIQVNYVAKKDDAAEKTIREKCRVSGSDYNGTTQYLGTSYALYSEIRENNPATGSAWSVSDLESAEFGAEIVS